MRKAKDLWSKSAADMVAVFGVKADFDQQPREWGVAQQGLADPGTNNTGLTARTPYPPSHTKVTIAPS